MTVIQDALRLFDIARSTKGFSTPLMPLDFL